MRKLLNMTLGQIEKTVLGYLENRHTLSLATVQDGVPHSANLFFVNRGFIIHFLSSKASRHGANIAANPLVSATITEDYRHWQDIKGIQLAGFARTLGPPAEHPGLLKEYLMKFPLVADFLRHPLKFGEAVAKKVAAVHFYELTPERIYFINNDIAFGHREELILPQRDCSPFFKPR